MRGSTRPGLALGFSFLLHSAVALSAYMLAPAVSTQAGIEVVRVNTRTGPPRALHLSLWDEKSPAPKESAPKLVEPSTPAPSPPTPAPQQVVDVQPVLPPPPAPTAPPSFEVVSPSSRSDYAALTRGAAARNNSRSSEGSSLGSGGSRGARGLGFFKVSREVRSVVFVIDGSASMGEEGSFDEAKRELAASIEELRETTKFQVIVYNKNAAPLRINGHVDLVQATPANKEAAFALIRALDPEGGTDHVRAMQQALILWPEAIIFVTDADGLRADQVHALTVFNHGRSTIHTIELNTSRRREQSPLQILAEQNHGDFRVARAVEK